MKPFQLNLSTAFLLVIILLPVGMTARGMYTYTCMNYYDASAQLPMSLI
jgi:hypothetical protein